MNDRNLSKAIVDYARSMLTDNYLPKIKRCLDELTEEEVWLRPNPSSNSVGNILLHLSGNLRQWIVHGVGGTEDRRERSKEFSEQGPIPKATLIEKLQSTLQEVDSVLKEFDAARLLEEKSIQGYDVTYFYAIQHVVEHFSLHLGQISYITKMRKDVDLNFYPMDERGYRKKQ